MLPMLDLPEHSLKLDVRSTSWLVDPHPLKDWAVTRTAFLLARSDLCSYLLSAEGALAFILDQLGERLGWAGMEEPKRESLVDEMRGQSRSHVQQRLIQLMRMPK